MRVKAKIKGDTWSFYLVSEEKMKSLREDGADLGGLCLPETKQIYFEKSEFKLEFVKHELIHAYASYLHLGDTNNISLDDLEEIFASMFAADGEKIIRQARRIWKGLK